MIATNGGGYDDYLDAIRMSGLLFLRLEKTDGEVGTTAHPKLTPRPSATSAFLLLSLETGPSAKSHC